MSCIEQIIEVYLYHKEDNDHMDLVTAEDYQKYCTLVKKGRVFGNLNEIVSDINKSFSNQDSVVNVTLTFEDNQPKIHIYSNRAQCKSTDKMDLEFVYEYYAFKTKHGEIITLKKRGF